MYIHAHVCTCMYIHVHVCTYTYTSYTYTHTHVHMYVHVHDVIGDVERKKERKKDTRGNGKMKNESCLRWDSNPRHSVLRTDACTCTHNSYTCTYIHTNLSFQFPIVIY